MNYGQIFSQNSNSKISSQWQLIKLIRKFEHKMKWEMPKWQCIRQEGGENRKKKKKYASYL